MIYGIDLGSTKIKYTAYDEMKKSFIEKKSYQTFEFYRNYSYWQEKTLNIDMKKLRNEEGTVISTGYGRYNIRVSHGDMIPEIQAHVHGALFQTRLKDFLLIDIGGQDSKVIKISNGKIDDFSMNDKCAASAGRFLDNMAQQLTIPIEELGNYYENPVKISSTCAVFSESEVVSKLIRGIPPEEIAAGVNYALFQKIKPLIYRHFYPDIYLSGGAALNQALSHYIRKEFNCSVNLLPDVIYNGAIGCIAYHLNTNV